MNNNNRRSPSIGARALMFVAIGLAMLSPALARLGGEIDIRGEQGEILRARIAPTPFYDPKNARQRPVAAA